MKISMKAIAILMVILTVFYVSVVVYANVNSNYDDVVYAAFEYESETTPTNWYMPEQLGIVKIIEYEENGSWLHIVVDPKQEPFPLQEEQPIFLYNSTFYQVSPLWVTPGLPESVKQWQIPIGGVLGVGWVLTGAIFLKERKP
jgi:hypothetical protein